MQRFKTIRNADSLLVAKCLFNEEQIVFVNWFFDEMDELKKEIHFKMKENSIDEAFDVIGCIVKCISLADDYLVKEEKADQMLFFASSLDYAPADFLENCATEDYEAGFPAWAEKQASRNREPISDRLIYSTLGTLIAERRKVIEFRESQIRTETSESSPFCASV